MKLGQILQLGLLHPLAQVQLNEMVAYLQSRWRKQRQEYGKKKENNYQRH